MGANKYGLDARLSAITIYTRFLIRRFHDINIHLRCISLPSLLSFLLLAVPKLPPFPKTPNADLLSAAPPV